MRFITIAIYSLKINVLNLVVGAQRLDSLSHNFLPSLTYYQPSVATAPELEQPFSCQVDNATHYPII